MMVSESRQRGKRRNDIRADMEVDRPWDISKPELILAKFQLLLGIDSVGAKLFLRIVISCYERVKT
jgi:hypothetical protein